jgi:hypothetical protein
MRPQPLHAHTGKRRLAGVTADSRRRRGEQGGNDAKEGGRKKPSEELGREGKRSLGHGRDSYNTAANR